MGSSPKRRRSKSTLSSVSSSGGLEARRKKNTSDTKKKKKKSLSKGALIAMIAIPIVMVAVFAGAIYFIPWDNVVKSAGLVHTPESLTEHTLSLMSQEVELLKSVKNAKKAKAIGPQFISLSKQIAMAEVQLSEMISKDELSKEEEKALAKKYEDKHAALLTDLDKEITRLKGIGEISEVIVEIAKEAESEAKKIKEEAASISEDEEEDDDAE